MFRRTLLTTVPALVPSLTWLPFDPAPKERQTAVVDRIVNGTAVVLFEADGTQRTVEATVLPEDAREAGTVLRVPDGESLALAEVDHAATRERARDADDRFGDLSERPG